MGTQKFHGVIEAQQGTTATSVVVKSQFDSGITGAKDRAQHTGTQTASTISDFTTAVNALVQSAITALVGGAPGVLDTLNELAAALGNDQNFATTTANRFTTVEGRVTAIETAGIAPAAINVPALSGSAVTITHNKGRRVICQVIDTSNNQVVYPVVTGNAAGSTTLSLDFGSTSAASGAFVALVY